MKQKFQEPKDIQIPYRFSFCLMYLEGFSLEHESVKFVWIHTCEFIMFHRLCK